MQPIQDRTGLVKPSRLGSTRRHKVVEPLNNCLLLLVHKPPQLSIWSKATQVHKVHGQNNDVSHPLHSYCLQTTPAQLRATAHEDVHKGNGQWEDDGRQGNALLSDRKTPCKVVSKGTSGPQNPPRQTQCPVNEFTSATKIVDGEPLLCSIYCCSSSASWFLPRPAPLPFFFGDPVFPRPPPFGCPSPAPEVELLANSLLFEEIVSSSRRYGKAHVTHFWSASGAKLLERLRDDTFRAVKIDAGTSPCNVSNWARSKRPWSKAACSSMTARSATASLAPSTLSVKRKSKATITWCITTPSSLCLPYPPNRSKYFTPLILWDISTP